MQKKVVVDVVIVGGGIAGLWLLQCLLQQGFTAIILEGQAVGAGQTHLAQGIIHGGIKYLLPGQQQAASAIAAMPAIWRNCLKGQGELNLTDLPILAEQQYLWSPYQFSSKPIALLAKLMLRTTIKRLKPQELPIILKNPLFKGWVYSVPELVLDIPLLLERLMQLSYPHILQVPMLTTKNLQFDTMGNITALQLNTCDNATLAIHAQQYIFTAGIGNEMLTTISPTPLIRTQRRPLHMVYVKHPTLQAYYAHCLSATNMPRLTISTHYTKNGSMIWYLGGRLAESGVQRNAAAQIAMAQTELAALFPWLNWQQAQFGTFMIDRAEPLVADGQRPNDCYFIHLANIIAAWPIKLALAPKLAADILQYLQQKIIPRPASNLTAITQGLKPKIATPPWHQL
jgi:hypothetical protein